VRSGADAPTGKQAVESLEELQQEAVNSWQGRYPGEGVPPKQSTARQRRYCRHAAHPFQFDAVTGCRDTARRLAMGRGQGGPTSGRRGYRMRRFVAATSGWRVGAIASVLLVAAALASSASAASLSTNLTATAPYCSASHWERDQ